MCTDSFEGHHVLFITWVEALALQNCQTIVLKLLQPELMCLYQNVAPPSSELAHPLQVYLAWLVAEGVDHWDQGSC